MKVQPERFEYELFQSSPLRRLKHLHHFGAGSLVSPIHHSRYDHTIGVWVLAKHYFPEWKELHAAAILHDVGHLPFSHAIEWALGLNHHVITEKAIQSEPVASILYNHGFSVQRIIDLLNQNSPLTHRSDFIGLDHLDSFLRDTQAAGKSPLSADKLVRQIQFRGNYVDTDTETAFHLLNAVVEDNLIFLSPYFLAVDSLLAEAVVLHLVSNPEKRDSIASMTDYQLTHLLENSPSKKAHDIMRVLLWEPHRIVRCESDAPEAFRVEIRKAYIKQPLVEGVPIINLSPEAPSRINELQTLVGRSYYFQVRRTNNADG